MITRQDIQVYLVSENANRKVFEGMVQIGSSESVSKNLPPSDQEKCYMIAKSLITERIWRHFYGDVYEELRRIRTGLMHFEFPPSCDDSNTMDKLDELIEKLK